jgi:hypothetical protein
MLEKKERESSKKGFRVMSAAAFVPKVVQTHEKASLDGEGMSDLDCISDIEVLFSGVPGGLLVTPDEV